MADTPKPALARDLFRTIGVSGLARYGAGLNVKGTTTSFMYEEWLPELRGDRGRRIYREMRDTDPVIGGMLFAVEMLIRNVPWTVKPANDSSEARKVADFIEECIHDLEVSWTDQLAEILSMLTYGWSYHELLFKRRAGQNFDDPTKHSKHDDNKIGWRAIAIRGQESLYAWEYDDFQALSGMVQLGPPDWQIHHIPYKKSLLFRTATYKGSPEGRSILRNAFAPYYAKKHIQAVEGIGIERDLAGLPVAYVPPQVLLGATPEDQEALLHIKQLITNIRRDEQEGVVFPLAYDESGKETYKLALLSSGGSRSFDTDKIIQRYESRIAMTILADFIMLGHETTGTYSLGESKLGVFGLAIATWLDTIAGPFNERAIPQLLHLNGMDLDLAPTLEHAPIEQADLAQLGGYLTVLNTCGLLPKDAALIKHLFELAELPPPEDDVVQDHVDSATALRDATLKTAQEGPPVPAGTPVRPGGARPTKRAPIGRPAKGAIAATENGYGGDA